MGTGVNTTAEESIPALDNGNGYSIPHVDENGNLTITNIDPDMPCGKLDGQTSEQVVNDWIDTNYPNTSQEELANMGINVSFNEGGEEYTLNGELVTEEEYNEANTGGDTQIFDNGNDSSLKNFVPSESGYGGTWQTIGGSHKEPGKIEISIDIDKFNNTLNNWMNGTITKQQEETINKIMEDKFGVKDVVSAGLSVKKAYGKIKKVLEGKLGAEYPKSSIAAIAASLLVDPAMDALDWENFWDADEGTGIRAINIGSKVGAIAAGVIAGTAATGVGVPIALGLVVVFAAIDASIEDYDDLDIFSFNEETGNIEWNFNMTTTDGEYRNTHGTIEIDYTNPQQLYNSVALHIETAKLQILKELDILSTKRGIIITQVKAELEEKMQNVNEETAWDELKALTEIYDICLLCFASYPYISNSTYGETYGEDKCYVVRMICGVENIASSYVSYRIDLESKEMFPTYQSLKDLNYKDFLGNVVDEVVCVSDSCISDDMLKIHGNNYVKSYYNYYANKGNRDTFVEELIIEDCVHTGEVDLWTGLQINNNNMTFFQHNIEWGDSYFSDPLSSESVQEAGKNWTNFMAENRINLSKELVKQIYSDIMVILGNYSNITEKINEKEDEIVDLWEKAFSGNEE